MSTRYADTEYMDDSPRYALDRESQESFILDEQDGHPEHRCSASVDEEDEELPIHVPDYPTCPHPQVLEDETQVEEWIEARAMEFAFTKHGERKPKKPLQEVDESPEASRSQATMVVLLHSTLGLPNERTNKSTDETLRVAEPSRCRSSPTMQVMKSLALSPELIAMPNPNETEEQHGPLSPIEMYRADTFDESKNQVVPDSADDSSAGRRRGAPQYDSIVEYRCCWSGTYRPRAYTNKTGKKRKRAPSTKVGCKARFVIRKVSKTGQFHVTYHWEHNGHDPTDLEQIKRMRSKQLAEPIKEHIRKKNEAAARRDLDRQVQVARARARQAEEEALAKKNARETKRKREQVQLEQGLLEPMSPYSNESTCGEYPSHDAFPVDQSGTHESDRVQVDPNEMPSMIPEPRVAAKEEIAIDPSLDECGGTHTTFQSDASGNDLSPGISANTAHFRAHSDAQYHSQQMAEMVPAPQSVDPNFLTRSGHLSHHTATHPQQSLLLPQSAPVDGFDQQFLMQQQLPGLRTPAMLDGFRQPGQLLYGSSRVHSPIPVNPHAASMRFAPPIPLHLAYEQFRRSVNLAVVNVHKSITELEHSSEGLALAGPSDRQRQDENQIRHEMHSIARLGDDLVQRVQGFAQRFGSVTARKAGMQA